MKLLPSILLLSSFWIAGVGAGSRAYGGEPGKQEAVTAELKFKIGYQLFLPTAYGKDSTVKWPLIIFLHGSGERGSNLDQVKVHGPPKIVETDKDFPFVVLSPQCPDGQRWNPTLLSALLDDIESKYSIDADRIYLTGLSMGGFGTWEWAMAEPHRFAALVPICGHREGRGIGRVKHIPTWIFHGAKDTAVPVKGATDIVAALEKEGGKPKVTIYPDAGHDSWTVTYNNPELYKWLLEQKRPAQEQKPGK